MPFVFVLTMVGLLGLLGFSSYRNVQTLQQRMKKSLSSTAELVIQSLEAGVRAGMVSPVWDVQDVQQNLLEISQVPGVSFLAITDAKGTVLFHSDVKQVGKPLRDFAAITKGAAALLGPPSHPDLFIRNARFAPLKDVQDWDTLKGRLLLQRWFAWAQRFQAANISLESLGDLHIVVGLHMDDYLIARSEEIQRAIFHTITVFLVAGIGIWVIFFYYGTQTTRRAYSDLRRTTDIILQNLPTGLMLLDKQGLATYLNPEAQRILDVSQSEAEERSIDELLPQVAPGAAQVLDGSLPQAEIEVEIRRGDDSRRDDGSLIAAATVARLLDSEGEQIGASINLKDLTSIRKLERQIQRSDRLISLGRFAAGIAHELRNPLSSIRGLAQYLAERHKDDPSEAECFQIINTEIVRLNRKLSELVSFARHEPPAQELIDPAEVLKHAIRLIEPDLRMAKVRFEVQVPTSLGHIQGNADRLHQAFLNILLNAIDAAGESGSVSLAAKSKDGQFVAEIADSGPGITPDEYERIFEPFYTTKTGGLGLGLSITHGIVSDHHGTIEIRSAKGKGTTMILSFPLAKDSDLGMGSTSEVMTKVMDYNTPDYII